MPTPSIIAGSTAIFSLPPSRCSSQEDIATTAVIYRRKRKLQDDEGIERQWGRTLGRLIDTYNDPKSILDTGVAYHGERATHLEKEYKSFTLLIEHIPALETRLDACVTEEFAELGRNLKYGQDSSRSDDTSTIKKAIFEMLLEFDRGAIDLLTCKQKDNRGFNHPLTGKLLCPAKLDWDDEHTSQSLKSGEYALEPTDWPLFFYEELYYDPEDDLKGLLKGTFLIWTYKCIFLGPSTWAPQKDGTSKSRRASKSRLAVIEKVTPRSIGYVAMMAYFALSTAETNKKYGASFDLSAMFWQIVELFEVPELKEETDVLLLWWNRLIFPSKFSTRPREDTENPLVKILAQKRAKIAHNTAPALALQDSTNILL